jgi:two-component system OmpR family response regulator
MRGSNLQASAPISLPRARSRTTRLLLVEDDVKLARALSMGLKGEGYEIDVEDSGDGALARAGERDYDAVVLDVMLPGVDGFTVCETLRRRDPWIPVLMLTALGDVQDRVRGLDMGADDYLVKPFAFDELLARLRALTRRGPSERPVVIELGGLRADPLSRVVTWSERSIELTQREFDLLEFLLRRPRQVVSRAQMLDAIWGPEYAGSRNVVDVYVGYLRRKLESGTGPRLIRTVRGEGFVLELG